MFTSTPPVNCTTTSACRWEAFSVPGPFPRDRRLRRGRALDEGGAPGAPGRGGRLLHEAGHLEAAATHYRQALALRPSDSTAAFNLGVALEDQRRHADAIRAYETAIGADGTNADAHFNLARLLERAGRKAAAIRHLNAYRRLTRG